jgi:5'-3' exonuclease
MTTRLHLVDGTFELFRAHYSKRPDHRTPSGMPFKAVAGLVSSMMYLLRDPEEAVTHVAIAFDNPIRSFRNDLYDGYKTEEGVDPALLAQFDAAEEATRALGMVVLPMDRYECDDALATGAARFRDRVDQVRILTPDKDLGQCIVGDHVVLVDRIRKTVIDEAGLRERRGIVPESIPDFLALVGDAADGIPGIAGFGEKSAALILGRFIHLEAIPPDAAQWNVPIRSADRLAATLRAHRDEALLYRKLATLVTDVPIAETFEELEYKGRTDRFDAWSREAGLDFSSSLVTPRKAGDGDD